MKYNSQQQFNGKRYTKLRGKNYLSQCNTGSFKLHIPKAQYKYIQTEVK